MEEKKERKQRQIKRTAAKTNTKKQTNKTTVKKVNKTAKKEPKQISIFTVLLIVVIIAAFIGIYYGISYVVVTLKYKQYTDKMNSYGYNELYLNKKATAAQKVTNAELIKVVIGSLNNTKDISNLYHLADATTSDELKWYKYANYMGVDLGIKESDLNENASVIDAVMLATNIIDGKLGTPIEQTKLEMKESKLKKYSQREQELIAKAVTLGLIKNKNSALDESGMVKGQLNKIVVTLVNKYATIYYKNTGNVKDTVSIVTDKDKLPTNYKDYPYIVDNISKEVYEQELKVEYTPIFKTPSEVYKSMGYLYGQTDYLLQAYFNGILNVDYKTITTKNFLNSIEKQVVYEIEEKDVEQYVKYVKDNKIKLEGKATPLLPIIYDTGEGLVVRTEVKFKVLNSETEYNILFGDEDSKIKYNGTEFTMFVDMPVGGTFNSKSVLVYINCLAKNLSSKTTSVVIEE